ncbi:hypothetical protein [Taklimakanibacter albus]|uniref:Uncharacterized protein n=1 Tax=Taklimakanibacter albus TaxID=2800327 RepID=A0ACC5RFX0_9HYPH|nr:hypothetical protein [Aestuariivirga sp. YIM B02566]MBK1871539.1 hypothetical protein [Aestuariivirga sp. YIM B02566]
MTFTSNNTSGAEQLTVFRDLDGKLHEDRKAMADANLWKRIADIPESDTWFADHNTEMNSKRPPDFKKDTIMDMMIALMEKMALKFWISRRLPFLQSLIDSYESDMGLKK